MGWHWERFQVLGVVVALLTTSVVGERFAQNNVMSLESFRRSLQDYDSSYFQYNLADFSLRFDRCQHVKMFDDEQAQEEGNDSPLVVKHFAVFRLCPSDSCDSCDTVYGSYVAEVGEYLAYTVQAQAEAFTTMCSNCQEKCNADGEYCSGCGKLCYRYTNLEGSGYIDAANYVQCQQLVVNTDDGGSATYYIGPRCSQDGSSILIGIFSDEECLEPYTDNEPEDFLSGKLSYHLLSHTYKNDGSVCLSCQEDANNENEADAADADDVNEMCEDIYNMAAKCESKHGLSGFVQMAKDDEEYENQVENEWMACNFIQNLLRNSYTESGDINLDDPRDGMRRPVSATQKVFLSLLSMAVGGLLVAVYYTNEEIEGVTPKIQLSTQADGAIA
jgi:hypothetical protein